jgi:hypothetical protein
VSLTGALAQPFGPRTDYPTGNQANAAVVIDVTGDGLLDVVSVSSTSTGGGAVWVQAGQAGGVFAAAVSYPTGALHNLAVGDVNNDNRMDVVGIGATLTVLLGQPGGTLGPPVTSALGGTAKRLLLRDLDSDGALDAITTYQNSDVVVVLRGLGTGQFGPAVIHAAGVEVNDLDYGDVTEDGIPDLVIVSQRNAGTTYAGLTVLPGQRNGSFADQRTYSFATSTSTPSAVVLTDLNNDGRLDAVVANSSAQNVSVFLSINNGVFAARVDYPLPAATTMNSIAAGDVNGDGLSDIVATNTSGTGVWVLLGTGSGRLGSATLALTNTYPNTVALGDVNADGRLDAVTANRGTNDVSVLLNTSASPSTGPTITAFSLTSGAVGNTVYLTGTRFVNVSAVRFNGVLSNSVTYSATQLTAVVPAGATTGSITVTTPSGTATAAGAFTVTPLPSDSYIINNLAVTTCSGTLYDTGGPTGNYANINNFLKVFTPATAGSKIQLSFSAFDLRSSFDNLYIYDGPNSDAPLIGTYTGTAGPGTVTATNSAGQLSVGFATVGGFTRAGFAATISCVGPSTFRVVGSAPASHSLTASRAPSVAVSFSAPPTAASAAGIRVHGSQRSGQRTASTPVVSGSTATLNLAGGPFLAGETVRVTVPATVQSTTGQLAEPYAYQFTPATLPSVGQFGNRQEYATGTNPGDVAIGDVTGDSIPDLVTCNRNAASISVLPGLGGGRFGAKVDYAAGGTPDNLLLGDFNNDGRLDVALTNTTAMTISVLLGGSGGGLLPRVTYPTSAQPGGLALGDLNGDGFLDLAVTNSIGPPPNNNLGTTVSLYYNSGTGTFASSTFAYTGDHPSTVAIVDMNHDGRLDLVVSHLSVVPIRVILNMGGGIFTTTGLYSSAYGSIYSMAVGDISGDGALDVVAVGQFGGFYGRYFGTERGTLPVRSLLSGVAQFSDDVKMGDLNGDGRLDVVVSNTNSTFTVWLNTPTGLGPTVNYSHPVAFNSVALGDVNNDGRLDIATVSGTTNRVAVLLNLGPPSVLAFTPTAGPTGTSVTLTGTNFSGTSSVLLNGQPVTGFVVSADGTSISFTVAAGATSGPISVTTPYGTTVTSTSFVVTNPQLTVTQGNSTYPSGGVAYDFGNQAIGVPSAPVVFTLTNASTTPLALTSVLTQGSFAVSGTAPATVPAGGTATVALTFAPTSAGTQAGALRLTSSLGVYQVNLTGTGFYPAPTIGAISPTSGPVGTTVTITGTGFGTTGTTVTLNGVAITGFVVGSNGTSISFAIPPGAAAGLLVVTTAGGSVTGPVPLCVQYTPTAAAPRRCGAGPVTFTASGAPAAAASNGLYVWYTQATAGQPVATLAAPTFTVPNLAATTTYYVAISTGNGSSACEGARTAVVATVDAVPPQPTITQGGGGVLTSSSPTGNQWFLNGVAIAGATGLVYTVPSTASNGNYTVVVTSPANCASLPSAGQVVLAGKVQTPFSTAVHLFPNPAHESCEVEIPGVSGTATVTLVLCTVLGEVVQQQMYGLPAAGVRARLNLHGLENGVYLLRIQAGATTLYQRLLIN